jgi:hypothetical protein
MNHVSSLDWCRLGLEKPSKNEIYMKECLDGTPQTPRPPYPKLGVKSPKPHKITKLTWLSPSLD